MNNLIKALVFAPLLIAPSTSLLSSGFSFHVSQPHEKSSLWSYKGLSLNLAPEANLTVPKKNKLVMASIKEKAQWELVRNRFRVVEYKEFDDTLFALIAIQSPSEWDALAKVVHNHDEFSCGRLQLIEPKFNLITNSTIEDLSYKPSKKLIEVENYINEVSVDNIRNMINTLESLETRYHNSTNGQNTPTIIDSYLKNFPGYGSNFNVTFFTHENTNQKSIIAKFTGTTTPDETLIFGAHLDSISPTTGNQNAPGADDDASGVASLIEIIRVLDKNNFKPHKSIEFQFYAAEEIGLVGSGEIARNYASNSKKISAMMQFDMNAWSANNDNTIYLVENDTTETLNQYIADLIYTYSLSTVAYGALPSGATSDHRSFNQSGYSTVFPFENPNAYNPNIHKDSDTTANLNNFNLSKSFTQLGLIFALHGAGSETLDQSHENSTTNTTNDVFIHLTQSQTSNSNYSLFVSTPVQVTSARYCLIHTGKDGICSQQATATSSSIEKNGRKIFQFVDEINLDSSPKIRITGIDEKNQTIIERNISISL